MIAKWYILHASAGAEKSIQQMIKDQSIKNNMSEYFEEIILPIIKTQRVKRGKNTTFEKKFMPGYLLIKMKMTDKAWHLVKGVPKVIGFLGAKNDPKALSDSEVKSIFEKLEAESKNANNASLYLIGDKVQVIDGPFDSFSGIVDEVNAKQQKLKVAISIFGKTTPIELNFSQIKKIELK